VVILTLRFLGFALRLRTTLKETKEKKAKKRTFTLPLALVLDLCSFFSFLLLYLLIGFNLARADNGVAMCIWALSFLPFAAGFSMLLYRLIALGSRVSPFLKKNAKAHATLTALNGFGKFLRAVQYLSLLASAIIGIVLVPAIPLPMSRTLAHVTIGLAGVFLLACSAGVAYQLERTFQIIKEINATSPTSMMDDKALKKTFRRLRTNQALVLVFAFPAAVFFLCMAGGAMRWAWYLPVIVTHGLETLCSLVLVFLAYHGSSSRDKASPTRSSSKNTEPKRPLIATDEVLQVGGPEMEQGKTSN
jgi:hypothetical protein